jgi:PAS domain S-box-containing protein
MDSEGNNLDTSSRWTEITGLSKERTRNMGWLEALHPDDVEPTIRALQEGLRMGTSIDVQYRVKRIDLEWRWMRSRGSPRRGPGGEVVRWYGSVEDIHDRRQMEETLHRACIPFISTQCSEPSQRDRVVS